MTPAAWDCGACGLAGQPATGHEASGFVSQAGGDEFVHPPYRVCECARCGAWQKTARLDDEDLERYYSRLEHESFETEALMPPDRLIVAAAGRLPPGRRILDYGCGVARTLARSVGRHACFGVEPNARSAAVAAARGVTIVPDSALESAFAEPADLVVLADVYEHLVRPLETFRRLAGLLAPGGALMLLTGCVDRLDARRLLAESWYFRVPGHLRMVAGRHLDWIASEAGLALESAVHLSHYDSAPLRDVLQRIRLWAYEATHAEPPNAIGGLVARLPVVGRAARWPNAPAVTSGADHVLAVFRKPGNAIR